MSEKIISNPCIECGGNACRAIMDGKTCNAMYYAAQPRGKWLQREDKEYKGGGYNFCTACQYRFSYGAYPLIYEADYCPHCGARMEEEGDTE